MRFVVIMAGGSGTRLWPLSRRGTPKQLLKIVAGRSLLRLAFDRALTLVPPERVLIVTGAAYLEQVREEVPELPEDNLLGEPVGRDSLNACAWPAAVVAARDPDAVIAQLTADHLIEPVDAFARALTEAFEVAETVDDVLVTLGVVPTSPHTGYGYLQRGESLGGSACRVAHFKEKPPFDVATRYVESGQYWWNSGMFVWRAATFLKQVATLEPQVHEGVLALAAEPERLAELFPTLRKTSVDFAIMEPVARGETDAEVVAVALPIQWRDVGGFESLAELLGADAAGNSVQGLVVSLDACDNLVLNTAGNDRLVAVVGLQRMIIVHTPDATLVTTFDQAEKVKALVGTLAESAPTFA